MGSFEPMDFWKLLNLTHNCSKKRRVQGLKLLTDIMMFRNFEPMNWNPLRGPWCPTASVCGLYELVEKVVVECTYIWRKMPQSSLLGPSLTVSVCRSRYLLCRSTLLIWPVVHLRALSVPIIVVVSGNVLPNFLYFKMIFLQGIFYIHHNCWK